MSIDRLGHRVGAARQAGEGTNWSSEASRHGLIEVEGAIHDCPITLALMPEAREVLPARVVFLATAATGVEGARCYFRLTTH